MKIKSYYSRTVEDAVASARQELGPEAMLVNTRKSPPEARHLGEYEVVFASLTPDPGGAQASSAETKGDAPVPGDRLSKEVCELKRELEGMRRAITRTVYAPAQWAGVSQDASDAYNALAMADVSADLAREIVQAASVRPGGAHPTAGRALQQALAAEISNRFTVDPNLGRGPATPRIAALIGPPGSGKTTTLVKLAVTYGLAARRGVLLLSLDTYRVAAADQLRSYAAILGVGFHLLETVAALSQAIEENRTKELILLDTPGLGREELSDLPGLARFLAGRPDVDTHLVLPASMKPSDLGRVVDAFDAFQPRHLIFSKLDETGSFGPILNETVRTGKPLSFFTTGQRIPEDLEAATREGVLDLILTGHGGKARSAA